tara:strand:- start:8253 stop:8999 length:747 start_codon:yes stop_codon:yes gene_type:complete
MKINFFLKFVGFLIYPSCRPLHIGNHPILYNDRNILKTAALTIEYNYLLETKYKNINIYNITRFSDRGIRIEHKRGNIYTFRGTMNNNMNDWNINLNRKLINYPSLSNMFCKIKVHCGFYEDYMKYKNVILNLVSQDGKDIVITGHSSGSAYAMFLALDIYRLFPEKNIKLVTFGMPKIGNEAFVNYVKKNIDIQQDHYILDDDIVSEFPLSSEYQKFDDLKKNKYINIFQFKKYFKSHSMTEYTKCI